MGGDSPLPFCRFLLLLISDALCPFSQLLCNCYCLTDGGGGCGC